MSYHPRIEASDIATLATSRSRNSELWFINNEELEEAILGYAAKFSTRYNVDLYGLGIEGNHLHTLAEFPKANRALFYRDFNSCVAKAVSRHVESYRGRGGGSFWARRYSCEFVPEEEDIEDKFFYIVLQAVQDGLVDHPCEYPGYNCFEDAINEATRQCKVINWAAYNDKKRWAKDDIDIEDFTTVFELKYKRLPGYDRLPKEEYRKLMRKKLEKRRLEIIRKRTKTQALGRKALKRKRPGCRPFKTKTSKRYSHRPRVLTSCPEKRKKHLAWYFSIYFDFKESSRRYRSGELDVKFPPGTYRPPLFTCKAALRPGY